MERLLEMELVRQCAPTIGWTQSGKSLPLCLSAFGQPLCFDQPDCHTAGEKEPFPRNAEL